MDNANTLVRGTWHYLRHLSHGTLPFWLYHLCWPFQETLRFCNFTAGSSDFVGELFTSGHLTITAHTFHSHDCHSAHLHISTQCTSYNVSFDDYISFFNSEIIILSIQKLLSRMRTVFQMLLSPNSRQRIIVDYLYKPGVVSIHYWCFLLHSYSPYQSLEGMLFKHSQSQYWSRMKIKLQRVQ